jgi:GH35 family endo-1,4-beta-xylanase
MVRWVLGAQLFILLALAQVLFAGYRVGVGNQSIQIPFLKHWIDPQLFANDSMVKETLADYPSYFFRLLAVLVARVDLYSAYFWLHVLTAAGVLWAAYELGKAIFKDRASGVVLVLLMLAGHHRALAGDDLYSVGFTHTWAVFPLAILAMVLLYKQWHLAAFALLGLIFNLHALTAGYLLFMFLAWAVFDYRRPGWWWRLPLMVAVFAVLASPTIAEMLRHRQQFDGFWLDKTRIRSADHSFPSSWWTAGASDVPRFALLVGLAAVSMSFSAGRTEQRKSLLLAAGAGVLFLVGWVLTDVWPVSTVVRAQLFRSSRLLVVLMLAYVAHGIVGGIRLGDLRYLWTRRARGGDGVDLAFPGNVDRAPQVERLNGGAEANLGARLLEVLLAIATFACVAVPGLLAVAPYLLVAAVAVALINGRLAWGQSLVASLAVLVTVAAWRTIEFHIPGVDGQLTFEAVRRSLQGVGGMLWIPLAIALAVWVIRSIPIGSRMKLCFATAALAGCIAFGLYEKRTLGGADGAAGEQRAWVAAQEWAAQNTPKSAVFLTPPQQGGFRIHSDRSVVCEWRDGTQLYFSAAFAKDWWRKLTSIRPVIYDAKGMGELMHAKTLENMSDREVATLAKSYGASYVVLPANPSRELKRAYTNGTWAVYEPRVLDEQDAFIENVAKPNIEKYRKSDVRLELTDADGRMLTGGSYEIRQTKQAFGFGVSMPFFGEPAGDSGNDSFEPPAVTPRELELVKAVFNYTVIPFSAKWQRLEPARGEWHYEELDKYVDWCAKNGITVEFHYLSGFIPYWARRLDSNELRKAWLEHCMKTVDRYHDRIKYWQVMNDSYMENYAADAFKAIRAKYPDLKLGISHCAQFYGGGASSMMRGSDDLEQVLAQGGKVDFFSSHGHKPMGCWPDMRQVYECLDAWAQYGVKFHISEATLDLGLGFTSPVKQADHWTPELAADFFEQYYTTLFSHPEVEAINYWDLGPSIVRSVGFGSSMIGGTGQAGLLDPDHNDAPRPLYNRLKTLIRDRWMTRLDGQIGREGTVAFRGFHGDYEITFTTRDGRRLKGTFSVKPGGTNVLPLRLIDDARSMAKGS